VLLPVLSLPTSGRTYEHTQFHFWKRRKFQNEGRPKALFRLLIALLFCFKGKTKETGHYPRSSFSLNFNSISSQFIDFLKLIKNRKKTGKICTVLEHRLTIFYDFLNDFFQFNLNFIGRFWSNLTEIIRKKIGKKFQK